jgi:hypothetical protein
MINPKNRQPEFINLLDPPPKNRHVVKPAPTVEEEASLPVDVPVDVEVEPVVEESVVEHGNMAAAMNKVAETLNLTRKVNTGSKPGEPAQRQVLIRASVTDHERWKKTAEARGMALSELIRELCNAAATEELECTHPAEFRKTYKWSDTCLKCNTRLRGWQ